MIAILALAAVLAAAPSGAPEDAKAKSVRPAAASGVAIGGVGKTDPDRIVCRRQALIGSRRPKKLCLTRAEWARQQDIAQRALDPGLWRQGGDKPPQAPK